MRTPLDSGSRASPSRSGTCSASRSPSSTRSTSDPCTRASAAATACTATRTASRSASAARSAPRRARPTASASSPAENDPRAPRLAGRALRAHLRDQHGPLHLLRLLRDRVPVRRDHARQRLRALRDLARRADLHQGDAARAAGPPHARRATRTSSTGARRRSRATACSACTGCTRRTASEVPEVVSTAIFYIAGAAGARLGDRGRLAAQPVPRGARPDPAPRGPGHVVPGAAGRLRRGGAGARVRRRRDDHVPVRDRLPRRPRGARADARGGFGAAFAIVAGARDPARDGDRGLRLERHPRDARRRSATASARRRRRPGCSSRTTCWRSSSSRSCCWSARSPASCSAPARCPAADGGSPTQRDASATTCAARQRREPTAQPERGRPVSPGCRAPGSCSRPRSSRSGWPA